MLQLAFAIYEVLSLLMTMLSLPIPESKSFLYSKYCIYNFKTCTKFPICDSFDQEIKFNLLLPFHQFVEFSLILRFKSKELQKTNTY